MQNTEDKAVNQKKSLLGVVVRVNIPPLLSAACVSRCVEGCLWISVRLLAHHALRPWVILVQCMTRSPLRARHHLMARILLHRHCLEIGSASCRERLCTYV